MKTTRVIVNNLAVAIGTNAVEADQAEQGECTPYISEILLVLFTLVSIYEPIKK